ncbi:amino acid adenylation domain-containing protein [Streptacidiphilus sp. MAP12-33]|uniref:non-ribosomal peptide synthetase n=1 Tax=Streptacidiphilus sp. MAP12-33 TaxID=3156266 RepID=UPI00351729C8
MVGAIVRIAEETGVSPETVHFAAQFKVIGWVAGLAPVLGPDETWRELVARVGTDAGRAEAERAWQGLGPREREELRSGRLAGYLRTALAHLCAHPDEPHGRRGLLPPEELAALDALAGPMRPLPDRRFHELFEDRVRLHPEAVAAEGGGRSWTYAELNARANQVAWSLLGGGLRAQDVVAVVSERTLEWLAAVIGVFKAGGCYLPLEPHFPAARIAAVLRRSACARVLAGPQVPQLAQALEQLPPTEVTELVRLLEEADARGLSTADPGVAVAADQLAYIYFTSGSTGEPKGAMCEHAGFLNHLLAKIEDLGIGEGHVVAQTAPQCFDISLWQLVAALLVGGRTHIVEQEVLLDVPRFLQELDRGGVQVVQLVPSYLEVLLATLAEHPRELPALACVSATGEALKKELVERWFAAFPEVTLVNAYGLTETSDDTNHEVMTSVPAERAVPIGRPIRNVRVRVVDEWLEPVPLGSPGEIVFSGVCVGRGYVNDEERTKAAFVRDPHAPGERLYRSGDFGRWLPSGSLEYLGRRDSQVKVNGFRIEIGEIENQLLTVPGVRDAAVVVAGSEDRPQLVAFYTGAESPSAPELGALLAQALPDYMVPGRRYRIDALPLTANGKTDKKELTARAAAAAPRSGGGVDGFEAPATPSELRVAETWAKVLRVPVEVIGRHGRFAEFAGTSLSALHLVLALDRVVTVKELVDTVTVAELAERLDRRAAQQ